MTTPDNTAPRDLFRTSLFSAFAEVLSQISGQTWKIATEQASPADAAVEVGFACEGVLSGSFSFRMSVAVAVRLAKLLTGEAVPESPGELSGDDREALEELLRQVAGMGASRLRADFGKLSIKFVGPSAVAPGEECISFSAVAESEPITLQLCLSTDLSESLRSADDDQDSDETKSHSTVLPPQAPTGALTHAAIREGNLELLWDVPLSLTLRFGQRELLLKQILELGPGAVLELDRQIDEPVDLLLGRKIIARGEVVIVDGNYGLRVTEVASAAEKLACLP